MAQHFDLAAQMDWTDLAEGEVRIMPLHQRADGGRIRLLVTRCGVWPQHVEEQPEFYMVLKGEVIYLTKREHRVQAGEAILFAPGEPHGARIENGAVSLNVDFACTAQTR
jgi:quercetin dioxygenase-like cupin family protein